jgi:hypothetical protein
MAARFSTGAKSLTILLILSLVVFVSGCTGTGNTVSYGKGVIIENFESDLGSLAVESGDDVGLLLRIQNQGELEAGDVEAELYNVDLSEWGTGFSWTGEKKDLGNLLAPDPRTNTEGETQTVQWYLEAPDLPKNTERTYTPYVRVYYDYKTNAQKPVTLVDDEELRRLIQQGKTLPGGITDTSAGPFSVEIKTGDFIKTQRTDDPFPLNIFITNDLWESGGSVIEGTGFFGGFGFDSFQYPVRVTITLPPGISLTGEGSDGCSTSGEWINLWKGKTAELTCEIRIDDPPDVREEKFIEVELEYRFYTDSSTTVKVIGTEDNDLF